MPSKNISTIAISGKILIIRGQKIMIDHDLATLYGIPTKTLNLAVKRNGNRFLDDFMFQLTNQESESLRFQIETSKVGRGGRRYLPFAFTEQGVAMLSSVLRSKRAIDVNIIIMRTFVRIREILINNKELALKLDAIEYKLAKHDKEISAIFQAIRRLMAEEEKPKGKIGFHT